MNRSIATNASGDCSDELDLGFSLLYLIAPLSLVIVCKSILVIVTVSRTSSLHTNTNFLVASMSVADLLMGSGYLCVGFIQRNYFNVGAQEQRIITNFVFGEWYSSILVGITHNGIVAIDRYILIAHPFFYMKHVTKRWILIVLTCVWIIALVVLFLPLLIYRDDNHDQGCILIHTPIEFYCLGTAVYFVNCITILACYYRIAVLAFKHKKAANTRKFPNPDNNDDTVFLNNFAAALRIVKFFALMFGVFLVCTLPAILVGLISKLSILPNYVYIPHTFFLPVNSIVNFIIYCYMNKIFAQAVRKSFFDMRTRACKRKMEMG